MTGKDLEGDVGRAAVEADAHRVQLLFQQLALALALGRVQHKENQIGGAGHGNHLLAAPFALRRAFDDTRQVQQLDVGPVVLETQYYDDDEMMR